MAQQTEECEAHEAKLVAELASQLALTRTDLSGISLDADRQREEAIVHRQLADSLSDKLRQAEAKISVVRFGLLSSIVNICGKTREKNKIFSFIRHTVKGLYFI